MKNLPFRMRRPAFFGVVSLLVALLAAGCQSASVQPFAEGVATVHTGVTESGAVFRDSAARVLPAEDERLATLEVHWKKRLDATSALVDYADSLASIVDAGNKGANSARDLAPQSSN